MFRIGAMVSCVLVVMTVVVYWQVPDLGFVGFDDPVYLAPELPVWESIPQTCSCCSSHFGR
jgi:hypothetical protein